VWHFQIADTKHIEVRLCIIGANGVQHLKSIVGHVSGEIYQTTVVNNYTHSGQIRSPDAKPSSICQNISPIHK
jgi:hypothetical protein